MLAPHPKSPWMTPAEHTARAEESKRIRSLELARTEIAPGVLIVTEPTAKGWRCFAHTIIGDHQLSLTQDVPTARERHERWVEVYRARK